MAFSILDVDQVLTSCSERFRGDEMPTCTGEWTRGDQRVGWQVQATPRPELGRMIRSTRHEIHKATQKEHVMQCDVLIALRGFYRDSLVDDDRLPMAERQQLRQQIEEGQVYNEWLDGFVAQLGLCVRMVRGLPRRGVPDDKFTQHSVEQLVDMYQASRARMAGLNCECCQVPEISALLEE
ncbi:hypothetical protein SLS63_011159 [Diaporthe eres]|uniref:Uncharacterized protein n=1 Tax=Diaporthe eres TaxID=83184 RepID=A0ABR1NV19_DIAER